MHQFIADTSLVLPSIIQYLGGVMSNGDALDLMQEAVKFTVDKINNKFDLNEFK